MTATHQSDREQTVEQSHHWNARVAVRVPRDGSDGLLGDARRRLARPAGIETVTVDRLCGLEPALAATVAQIELDLETSIAKDETELRRLLDTAPGTERVEHLERREG